MPYNIGGVSQIQITQIFQNEVLKGIVNARWYVGNSGLHRDLGVEIVVHVIKGFTKKHERRFHKHVNVEIIQPIDQHGIVKRFKRTKV